MNFPIKHAPRTVKHILIGTVLAGGALAIPAAATASPAAAVGEIVAEAPASSVVVVIDDGLATLSGTVPKESTRESLIGAALGMDEVVLVQDELRDPAPQVNDQTTGLNDLNEPGNFDDIEAK